jgi:TolA-binding protein
MTLVDDKKVDKARSTSQEPDQEVPKTKAAESAKELLQKLDQ